MLDVRRHESGATGNYWIYWIAGFTLIFVPMIGMVITCMVKDEKDAFLVGVGIAQILILVGAVTVNFLSDDGIDKIDQKWDSLNRLAEINGCVDEYTNLPVEAIQLEFTEGKE